MYQYKDICLKLENMPSDLVRSVGNVRLLSVPCGRKFLDNGYTKMVWGAVTLSKDSVFRCFDTSRGKYDDTKCNLVFYRDCYQVQLMDADDCIRDGNVAKRTINMSLTEMISRIDGFCRKDLSGLAYSDFEEERLIPYESRLSRLDKNGKDKSCMGSFDKSLPGRASMVVSPGYCYESVQSADYEYCK